MDILIPICIVLVLAIITYHFRSKTLDWLATEIMALEHDAEDLSKADLAALRMKLNCLHVKALKAADEEKLRFIQTLHTRLDALEKLVQ